mmetsp:Transcript_20869/g.59519  ORF Transcript_20869/g.59519 Transcript_20869/m.59519 type:complete len:81 (-) Transcript_20869:2329-2571(-)
MAVIPMEGIGTLFLEHGSHTNPPHERQLCLSLASCAALLDVDAHVNRLAQQEHVSSSSNGVHRGGRSIAVRADCTSNSPS